MNLLTPVTAPAALRQSLHERLVWLLAAMRGAATQARQILGLETLRPEHQERARSLLRAQHALDRAWCQLRQDIEDAGRVQAQGELELARERAAREKVKRGGPNECWEWQGAVGQKGHGQFWRDGRQVVASRVSYEMHKGPIPSGLFVCHTCDKGFV